MTRQSKIGSIGIGTCCCHSGCVSYITVFATGSESVDTNNVDSAIISTIGISSCGHPTVALTGSATVFKEGQASHRIGDMGKNCGPYVTVTGSENVEVGL